MNALKDWWTLDPQQDLTSPDNPHAPLTDAQRRDTLPLLTVTFGWAFLVTGLFTGGLLGNGMPFDTIIQATFIGNFINFVIGALVAYIGYKTACNSALLYRYVYGTMGARGPVIFVSILTICWQGIIVGAFGYAWTQSFDSNAFYAVAIFGGLLFTFTTYFGVKALEVISLPAVFVLVAVGLYAGYINVDAAGGWQGFISLSEQSATKNPLSLVEGINLVVASWIVGAMVMAEYSRFAKKAWVALAIPFIVMIIVQWFLQVLGAMGGIVSGSFDFTTYMLAQGAVVGMISVIAMSFALWTTGDTNLYLPSVQTASAFRRPQRVMTVICGLIGTIIGLGIYAKFMSWIELLAILAPPIIGPLIVSFYITEKHKYQSTDWSSLPKYNIAAYVAYLVGAGSTFVIPETLPKSLTGLLISMLAYFILSFVLKKPTA